MEPESYKERPFQELETGPLLNILIIEDNPGDVLIVTKLLRSTGLLFNLTEASTLRQALSLVADHNFDIVLLDLGLPDSIGVETLKKLSVFKVIPPVIVMTGLDDEDTALASLREGAQDYLVKIRLNSETLLRSIKYSIERKKLQYLLTLSELRFQQLNQELERKVSERTQELENINILLNRELKERNIAEEALRKSEALLRELNATKDKFFNIVAHDLKNPFTSLLGATELLFENIQQMDTEKIKRLAQILNDSAKSGYAILLNLLDWSRSQTGLIKINPERINIRILLDENISDLQLFSTNKEIIVNSEAKDDIYIFADKNMLNTVLRNLISNAIKFTHRGGNVSVKGSINDNEVVFSVKDSGTGISEDDIGQLFRIDSKFMNPGTEKEQGTGLGLKLSKEFVEKLGGKIWVRSKVNKGSEFIFSIPLITAPNPH